MMRIKCDYCENYITEKDAVCPHCGAPNPSYNRTANGIPKTIDELRQFCISRNLPLEKMRFFIGIDYREPRAFGIYRDKYTGDYIVYKNKSDGTRVIRYQGDDEAYAVSEIYNKIQEELQNQLRHGNIRSKSVSSSDRNQRKGSFVRRNLILLVLVSQLFIFGIQTCIGLLSPSHTTGYYKYGNNIYYNQYNDWYQWDTTYNAWEPYTTPKWDDYDSYYQGKDISFYYGDIDPFEESSFYNDHYYDSNDSDNEKWDSDWDNDYDYGGWDSGDTDWDTDW